jgi:hypothetical protein
MFPLDGVLIVVATAAALLAIEAASYYLVYRLDRFRSVATQITRCQKECTFQC